MADAVARWLSFCHGLESGGAAGDGEVERVMTVWAEERERRSKRENGEIREEEGI